MKKVVVTGANGFIGSYTLSLLVENGYEVHAISSKNFKKKNTNQILWHQSNLFNKSDVEKLFKKIQPSHLLHLAWYTEHGKFWDSELNLSWIQSSIDIFKSFKNNGGKRIVSSGTCAEYSWGSKDIFTENSEIKPTSLYGISKNCTHELLSYFSEINNISYSWGRVFFLYGPGESDSRIIPFIIKKLLNNEDAVCSHGNQIRDFMYVSDVASAFVRILESKISGPVNISTGHPKSIKDICKDIKNVIESKGKIIFGAIESPKDEPISILGNNDRLSNELNWYPSMSTNEGLKSLIEFHIKNSSKENK